MKIALIMFPFSIMLISGATVIQLDLLNRVGFFFCLQSQCTPVVLSTFTILNKQSKHFAEVDTLPHLPVDPAHTSPVDPAHTSPVDPAHTSPVDPPPTPPYMYVQSICCLLFFSDTDENRNEVTSTEIQFLPHIRNMHDKV